MEIDRLVTGFDRALRSLTGLQQAQRPIPEPSNGKANPANADTAESGPEEPEQVNKTDRAHAAGLMRVNHTGEICAQALYDGQALTARDPDIRAHLDDAAAEERDHLAWCAQRLEELDARPSVLNPLFYGASYLLGAVTGLAGDKVSLGFVEATEAQVVAHLNEHLQRLPEDDDRSRAILEQMRTDEARHGDDALAAGGEAFSPLVKQAMSAIAKVMTVTTYRI